jgi:hypothetical protein
MPVPPPIPDPSHIEMRLLVVAEMLEKAVAEVRRAMADVQGAKQSATLAAESIRAELDRPAPPDDSTGRNDAH